MFTVEKSTTIVKKEFGNMPDTLMILGSGWNKILDETTVEHELSYEELFGVKATVPGHAGRFVVGKLGQKRVALMCGRFHMYEGFTAEQSTLPIRVLAQSGIKQIIVTSACGALNPKYRVGDFVILSDILTLFLALDSPLKGPQFVDVSEVFDPEMRNRARKICAENTISFHEGVYAYYHGPNYETPADKMALRILGADVCGMSTVPEALVARSLGLKILGLSLVTNLAFVKHEHAEVLKEASRAYINIHKLLMNLGV